MANADAYSIEKLTDQFGGTTRAVRRNLLIASAVAIALSLEELKFGNIFGIDLQDVASAGLAVGAVGLIVLYEFVSFCVYATIDHRSWTLKNRVNLHNYQAEAVRETQESIKQVADQLGYIRGKMTSDKDSTVEAIKSQSGVMDDVVEKSRATISEYSEKFAMLKKQMDALNMIQVGRIYVVDWGIPVFMASLALVRTRDHILKFIGAVFT